MGIGTVKVGVRMGFVSTEVGASFREEDGKLLWVVP